MNFDSWTNAMSIPPASSARPALSSPATLPSLIFQVAMQSVSRSSALDDPASVMGSVSAVPPPMLPPPPAVAGR